MTRMFFTRDHLCPPWLNSGRGGEVLGVTGPEQKVRANFESDEEPVDYQQGRSSESPPASRFSRAGGRAWRQRLIRDVRRLTNRPLPKNANPRKEMRMAA